MKRSGKVRHVVSAARTLLLAIRIPEQRLQVATYLGVWIHWTGLLDWTAGLDYWTHHNVVFYPINTSMCMLYL